MRSQHTLPVRGARFKCGHATTLDNVTYRRKHVGEPYTPVCKACEAAYQAKAWRQRAATKRVRKPWISAPSAVVESCRAQYEAAIAQQARKVGRPKTSPQTTTHSEAA